MTAEHQVVVAGVERRRPGVVAAAFVWSAVVLLWALLAGVAAVSDRAQVVFIAMALTALGLIGAAAMSRDLGMRTALARLKLGPWMAIGFALVFGLATFMWLGGNIQGYNGVVTSSTLGPASVVAGLGFVAFLAAYHLTPQLLTDWGSRTDSRLRGGGSFNRGAVSVWALWFLGVTPQAVGIWRGNLGYLSGPVTQTSTSSLNAVLAVLTSMGVLSTMVAAWRFAVTRKAGSAILLAWVGGSLVVLGLFSGMKEAALIQFVALVVGYSARGKIRLVPVMVAGLVALFVVAPFITAYRAAVVTGSGVLAPAEALQRINFATLFSDSIGGGESGGNAADRLSRIGDLAIVVTMSPATVPFVSPVELATGPVMGFVPRSIWADKPVQDAGYRAYIAYYGGTVRNSAALTPYGDLYRHGGIVVVIAGMGLLGMFVRVVDDRDGATVTADPRLMFLPMLLFTTIVKQEMDYVSLSASVVSVVVAAAFAVRLVSRGVNQTHMLGPPRRTM